MAVINFNAKKSENLISFEELTTQAQNLTAVSGQIDYEKILDGLGSVDKRFPMSA